MTERSSIEVSEERRAQIASNIAAVREKIAHAEQARGTENTVVLLAATKTVPACEINYATQVCGITDIGENRVQELLEKYDDLVKDHVRIHFIGQLQTNKVKYIVDKVDMIHSVDSERLAREIDRRASKIGKVMDVLIEVNSGREENKGGVMPEQAAKLAEVIDTLPSLRLCGLMTIAPVLTEKDDYRKFFEETSQLSLDIFTKTRHNKKGIILSMGMSDSYPQAIACGSTLVRIGSLLFGARH